MELVINISEDDYYDALQYVEFNANTEFENLMIRAIKNGTPLPKGHGRLIDVDELLKEKRRFEDFDGDIFNIIHEETVINAPTIIEASSEED